MKTVCVIPARFASHRLPGKPMLKIGDAPMIEWVYKRACRVKRFEKVLVATDNELIFNHLQSIGGQVIMTPEDLSSGTDRVAFVARDIDADVFLNLQGDEPLIAPEVLEKVCNVFDDPEVQMATPVTKIKMIEDLTDPSLVRVALDNKKNALYFTRSVIPFFRDVEKYEDWITKHDFYKHIGIYAYRKDFLLNLTNLKPGILENVEKLEQLRVLENGFKIRTVITDYQSQSVDTKEDLVKLNKFVSDHQLTVEEINAKM